MQALLRLRVREALPKNCETSLRARVRHEPAAATTYTNLVGGDRALVEDLKRNGSDVSALCPPLPQDAKFPTARVKPLEELRWVEPIESSPQLFELDGTF